MIERSTIFSNALHALLGNVPTSLRALVIKMDDDKKFSQWTAYFDDETHEDELEAINVANTEFFSSFTEAELTNSEVENVFLPWPQLFPWQEAGKVDGYLVYMRYEKPKHSKKHLL